MNINSENIQKKEFHIVFKGYKPEEVDKFLDILAVEFDRLQKSQRELQENMEKLKYEGDRESVEMKRVIQEALVSAHKIAEDIKQKAEQEAEEMLRTKVAEEEESYKSLLSKKEKLERDIQELSQEYEDFKTKISKMVDDFKEITSKLGEGKFFNISRIGNKDLDVDKVNIGESESTEKDKEPIYPPEEELEIFGAAKKKEEEGSGMELIEESGKEGPFKEEEKKYGEEEEKMFGEAEKQYGEEEVKQYEEGGKQYEEEEKQNKFYDDSGGIEESDDEYKPKRVKKKIDIAKPDIINDFFKTDEDWDN